MRILDFALKMEQDGMAFYKKLDEDATLPGLRTIFSGLAADEQKHYDIFLALKRGGEALHMADSTILATTQTVFTQLAAQGVAVKGDLESYRFAMQLEAESFRLYEKAANAENNAGSKALLLRIADEERKHFNILENIHAFVNAPTQYLAWGEFSNLDEFRNFGRSVDQ